MSFTTLITADQLRAAGTGPSGPVVIEASFDLADVDAGEAAWRAGHLPGSHYAHLDRDLSGAKTGQNGRHPLPERRAFAQTLARFGVTPKRQVVALDRQGGVYAARLWWMLRWLGHAEVAVLDGSLAAWSAAGGKLTTEATPAAAETPPYPERHPLVKTIGADALLKALDDNALIDARAGERFRGEVEPLDKIGRAHV